MDFLSYQSIPAILKYNSIRYRDRTAISYKKSGVFLSLTYDEFYTRVLQLARGLCKAGMHADKPRALTSDASKRCMFSHYLATASNITRRPVPGFSDESAIPRQKCKSAGREGYLQAHVSVYLVYLLGNIPDMTGYPTKYTPT